MTRILMNKSEKEHSWLMQPHGLEILNGKELSLGRRKKIGAGGSQERQVNGYKERGGPC